MSQHTVHSVHSFPDNDATIRGEVDYSHHWPISIKFGDDVIVALNETTFAKVRTAVAEISAQLTAGKVVTQ